MNDDESTPPKASTASETFRPFDLEPIDGGDIEFKYNVYSQTIKPYIDALYGWDEDQHVANLWSLLESSRTPPAIVVQGKRVGAVQIEETRPEISLRQIAILPEYQKLGTGTAIIKSLMTRSRATQKPVRLSVFQGNTRARRLYERLGFKVVSESAEDAELAFTPPES
ncbi:MAG: GNAT family N-acetyltransferase [Thermomicrobiales bacterium]